MEFSEDDLSPSSLIVDPNSIPRQGSGQLLEERCRENEIGEYIPVCYDLEKYFKLLRESKTYKKILEKRKSSLREKSKEEGSLVSDEEIEAAFWQTEEFKQFFWDFNEYVIHLGYDEGLYPPEFRELLEKYIEAVHDCFNAAQSGNPDLLKEKDLERSRLHDETARALLKSGRFPDEVCQIIEKAFGETNPLTANNIKEFLARILVRAFLVDMGEDYIESARQSDLLRKLRVIENEWARRELEAEFFEMMKSLEKFPPEEIKLIREKFCQANNNKVTWRKREEFSKPK
ncbi:MAG: hypothetical protein ACPLKP_00205 [Microgenomates group bacterium]